MKIQDNARVGLVLCMSGMWNDRSHFGYEVCNELVSLWMQLLVSSFEGAVDR